MSLPKASATAPSFGQSLRGALAECERLRTKLSAAARNADTQAHYTLALLAECRELFAAASSLATSLAECRPSPVHPEDLERCQRDRAAALEAFQKLPKKIYQ